MCEKSGFWVSVMQLRLQADIYLTGDRGAGREVRARAGQLCPPVEFGMCPPRASRRPGVKVNKGAIWTASSNPFFHPPSHSPVTWIGHFIHWPRPPAVTHTIAPACRLLHTLRLRVQTFDWALFSAVWHRFAVGHNRSGVANSLSPYLFFTSYRFLRSICELECMQAQRYAEGNLPNGGQTSQMPDVQ